MPPPDVTGQAKFNSELHYITMGPPVEMIMDEQPYVMDTGYYEKEAPGGGTEKKQKYKGIMRSQAEEIFEGAVEFPSSGQFVASGTIDNPAVVITGTAEFVASGAFTARGRQTPAAIPEPIFFGGAGGGGALESVALQRLVIGEAKFEGSGDFKAKGKIEQVVISGTASFEGSAGITARATTLYAITGRALLQGSGNAAASMFVDNLPGIIKAEEEELIPLLLWAA